MALRSVSMQFSQPSTWFHLVHRWATKRSFAPAAATDRPKSGGCFRK